MKNYQTIQLRNISLCGNSGSGKTTLAEAMLYEGGIIDRRGSVEQKNTVSDYSDIEHNNGSSVFSTVLYTEYQDHKINFIDNPGADDFCGGLIASLAVTDVGLLLINAQNGFEVGTEIQTRYLEKFNKPKIIVVNQLDHEKSNFEKVLEQLKERMGSEVVIVQYPLNEGASFNTLIDVLLMKQLKFPAEGGKPEISDIPAGEKARAEELRNQLIEKAAESDDKLMETFFEQGTLNDEELQKGLRLGLRNAKITPLLCVAARKNMGISRLMDFLCSYVPSPAEFPAPVSKEGQEIKCDASGNPVLFVFKTNIEPHLGEINFFKVMSGEITEGIDLTNNNNGTKERLNQLFAVAGKIRNKVPKMTAGDIGATVKLKNTKTNHTLSLNNHTVQFPPIEFPEPKFRTAIKCASEGDEEKLGEVLNRIHQEDPTILVEYSKELKQIIVSGQGEYHLNILKWHLDNIYKIATEFIAPKIPYRETITKVAQADYRHKKQSGGAGQFGEVHLVIEPYVEGAPDPTVYKLPGKEIKVNIKNKEEHDLPWGGKLVFINSIVGGAIDARFMPAILKGIMEKMEEGPLTGSYARDIRVVVYDGKMHPVDSNEISFRLAGRNAFKEAFKNAGPKILEPIYYVDVWVPSDRMGDVMSDLQGRRAIVLGMSSEKGFEKISAKVPLAEMNKYSTALSSLTQGRAIYTMRFAEYAQVPAEIQNELLKAYAAQEEKED